MSNLAKRVLVAVFAVPLILVAIRQGGLCLLVFVDLVIVWGIQELFRLQEAKGWRPQRILGTLVALAISWEFFFFRGEYTEFVPAGAVLLVLLFELCRRDSGSALANAGSTLLGIFYVGWLSSFLLLLRTAPSQADSGSLTILVLLSIWGADTAAYFVGRGFGKHRLFTRISPKKSVEGAIGGIVGALAVVFAGSQTFVPMLSTANCLALSFIIGIGSQLGDLIESLLKRDAGVKDSSQIIPGHGGVLDRFDSVFCALPLVYVYLKVAGILQ
ncbi:MAG: phosphatidate cytidylyltransferase [Candidatus Latescibacteria bacterium]|nr:phosphatidate cytidylyltransferase [Candidatus Latescibacterota bacterium]